MTKTRDLKSKRIKDKLLALGVILTIAIIGSIIIVVSRAASPYSSINADKGTLAGQAVIHSDSTSSDGKSVMFGSVPITPPSPPPTPPPPATCTTTINPSTSLATAIANASPGNVICLNPGTYGSVTITKGGSASSSLTITSTDPSNPATIAGRTVTSGGGSYLVLSYLKFLYIPGALPDAVVLGTPHVSFIHNDVNGANNTICINGVSYNGATVSYSLIDHNTVHDCGGSDSNSVLHAQGIYMLGGPGDVISNNWCWKAAARCYQIRGEQGGSWHNNVSDNSREGFIFGNTGAANNNVYNNIVGTLGYQGNGGNTAYEYQSTGSGNNFHDNCVSKSDGPWSTTAHSNNTVVAVQFVDAANHNYNLTSAAVNNPCRSFAAQNGNPGP